MKKSVLLLAIICICLMGCGNSSKEVDHRIQQLNDGKGTAVQITNAQIDTVNEILDKYYSDIAHPLGYNTADYEVSNIENTYLVKGTFGSLKDYRIFLTEKADSESYTLESF